MLTELVISCWKILDFVASKEWPGGFSIHINYKLIELTGYPYWM